ncbi:MAG: class I SAM-dependent methyltransferase [Pseudomonadota bacterium]
MDTRVDPVPEETSIERAYALKTPEDSVALYRDWADSYDSGYAETMGYAYPRNIAAVLLEELGGATPEIVDVGAGTGLVAEHLPGLTVDAIDISQEMLDVAGGKGLYRNRIQADLTQKLSIPDARYGAMISAGVFTHGHVGPVCLPELMRIAAPGAFFVLGINAQVFDSAAFGSAFAGLVADGVIEPVRFRKIDCFEDADHDHADTVILLAVFRKTGR